MEYGLRSTALGSIIMSSNDAPNSSNSNVPSKIFRRGTRPDTSDAAVTASDETLVQKQPMESTSQEEHQAVGNLMSKANTMSEEDFKKYLEEHKEEVEAMYRKQGGGIASGEWINSDYLPA